MVIVVVGADVVVVVVVVIWVASGQPESKVANKNESTSKDKFFMLFL